ncbi:uncharacterized protein LOC113862311 [Abrus precatorius]|uniref:Uncharacterized protein LOC113862311 n=1 Tax=Abrus precatorius TaxID=3816 RepID=A0A8B8L4R8_ABRPR|nr:uncharacterized protein LOC113862311 [Abrus precatorius]
MVHGREFEVDLICLPLSQLDVILEMDWLAANHVLLDCREKTLIFGATMAKVPRLMSQGAWGNIVNAKAFSIMFSVEAKSVVEPKYIPVVTDFLEVFPEDVSKLPPEREIEFAIDLILGASPISVVPYRMSPVELAAVKKQVKDLLQKRFVRLSVSPWGEPVLLIQFLGHVVSKERIMVDPAKVKAVAEWPRSMNVTEVRSFLDWQAIIGNSLRDFLR